MKILVKGENEVEIRVHSEKGESGVEIVYDHQTSRWVTGIT